MSNIFFKELKINKPRFVLNGDFSSHGKMTGNMLIQIEEILIKEKPIFVIVYGDTNSTLAGSLAAVKLNIPLVHIEAGLRSFNFSMPEEINRILTDRISNILFCSSKDEVNNLYSEGLRNNVFEVGDIMFDSLLLAKNILKDSIIQRNHIFLTLHRPYNTDCIDRLIYILKQLNQIGEQIVFPIHPRTNKTLNNYNIHKSNFSNINFVEPMSYFDSIRSQIESKVVITDSGGIQKEAYWLKKKCITIRSETEWTSTLINDWNTLLFDDISNIKQVVNEIPGTYIDGLYGYGNTSHLITEALLKFY
jgi:UDP-GlcNAc3NAcA epimerase